MRPSQQPMNPMSSIPTLRATENFHILLWLVKDLCWLHDQRLLATVMVVPTVLTAIWIAWRNREEIGDLLHSLAVVCWILANSVWMLGEFIDYDGTLLWATVFFAAGLVFVGWYYLVLRPKQRRGSQPTDAARS